MPASEIRPAVFVGSSSEGLPIAEAIQMELDASCEVTLWRQGVFGLGEGTLEALVSRLDGFDFAILVLTADDLTESRGKVEQSPRDNVLLELGIFIGRLGTKRTFALYDRTAGIRLPSDLAGVTMATYQLHLSGNLRATLGAACTNIKNAIKEQGPLLERWPCGNTSKMQHTRLEVDQSNRREEVVRELDRFLKSLQAAYGEASTAGQKSISESFSEKGLRKWKYDALKFLDANFEADEATPFADLHTVAVGGVSPLGHLLSSYEEHRDFLESLRTEVSEGRSSVKVPPRPSGNGLPRFKRFTYGT